MANQVQSKSALSSIKIAQYFLSLVDDDAGELMSNLKLQKLLYYAQGYHLAMFGRPLFSEPIEAWTLGPVVREVYDAYKMYGPGPIPRPRDADFSDLDEGTREFLDEIYCELGQFSAWRLSEMTHADPPWLMARKKGQNSVITHASLREHFGTLLEEN